MQSTTIFTRSMAFALGLGLAASGAQAADWCTYYDASGAKVDMLTGECLFMGNSEEVDGWGREVCGSRALTLAPQWNDRITAVKPLGPTARTFTLYLNVMKDENVFTQVVAGDTVWNIPTDHPFYSQASVAICE